MQIRFQGGYACGAIRCESSVDPQFSFHCQFRQCQRASGTGHASLLAVPVDALKIRGTLKFHDQKADSGNTNSRGFCPACGNPVVNKSSGYVQIETAFVLIHYAIVSPLIAAVYARKANFVVNP